MIKDNSNYESNKTNEVKVSDMVKKIESSNRILSTMLSILSDLNKASEEELLYTKEQLSSTIKDYNKLKRDYDELYREYCDILQIVKNTNNRGQV